MRKLYSLWLCMLCITLSSVTAKAALTTTIEWDIPGSVEIYVGSTNIANKAVIDPAATSFVATIDDTWGTTYVGAASGYEIKGATAADGTELAVSTWTGKVGIDMDNFNGQTIKVNVVKAEEEGDTSEDAATVTVEYQGDGYQAVKMVRNHTTSTTLAYGPIDKFDVKIGDVVRFTVNSFDYDVTIDGIQAPQAEGGLSTTTYVDLTIDQSKTITVAATSRSYGAVNVYFWASSIDDLEFTTVSGEPIDAATVTATGATDTYTFGNIKPSRTAEVSQYMIPVSAKDSRCFVTAKDGYWVESSEYTVGRDYFGSTMASSNWTLYVLSHKISKDSRLVVYVGTPDEVNLRDNQRNIYPLEQGYNEFEIDPSYSSQFTAQVLTGTTYLYNNYVKIAANGDEQFVTDVSGDALLHIFSATPTKRRVRATIDENANEGIKIVVDRMTELTADNGYYCEPFTGAEVTITTGDNNVTVNGEAVEPTDGVYTFVTTSKISTYDIVISPNKTSAITEAAADNTASDVITIDGCVVLRNATPAQIDALPKGIYIIGGKKVMK